MNSKAAAQVIEGEFGRVHGEVYVCERNPEHVDTYYSCLACDWLDAQDAVRLVRDIAEGKWDGAVVATGLREKAKEIAGK